MYVFIVSEPLIRSGMSLSQPIEHRWAMTGNRSSNPCELALRCGLLYPFTGVTGRFPQSSVMTCSVRHFWSPDPRTIVGVCRSGDRDRLRKSIRDQVNEWSMFVGVVRERELMGRYKYIGLLTMYGL
ncbi:hypothetical protein EA473_12760 [Natrarchaeobius chitinivorans]|uniref:Uncharacterized protein n=1 Tax=Natrarchaeobius chitinivorans TaxID=1679083 RepID=A0A3N6MJB3_NATCH|nr:hypothetical protein EA473_12760 [Natrarchaeobius chitinivorans]